MDKTIERLKQNIQKLDEMINEHEKRINVLQDSKLLMKRHIASIKYNDKVSRIHCGLNMDKVISKLRKTVGKK